MCFRYSGLHCVCISGWAKGVNYAPGDRITNKQTNHTWNAVHIAGSWHFVDILWATRYRNKDITYHFEDFYFLCEPRLFIYTHLPLNPAWQLMRHRMCGLEFDDYPVVKEQFFKFGLQFLQQRKAVIYPEKGQCTITLVCTKEVVVCYKLSYGEKREELCGEVELDRFILQNITSESVTFHFRAPKTGHYFLSVFVTDEISRSSERDIIKQACEFRLVVDESAKDVRPYPPCIGYNWGPGLSLKQYGLVPSNPEATVSAQKGKVQTSFSRWKPVQLSARLVSSDGLEKSVHVEEWKDTVCLSGYVKSPGEYTLIVYVCDLLQQEQNNLQFLCQYLIVQTDEQPCDNKQQSTSSIQQSPDNRQAPAPHQADYTRQRTSWNRASGIHRENIRLPASHSTQKIPASRDHNNLQRGATPGPDSALTKHYAVPVTVPSALHKSKFNKSNQRVHNIF